MRISITIGLILQLLEGCGEVMKLEKLPSIDDNCNQLEVAEYVDEIYQYYWVTEVIYNVFLSIALFFYQFIFIYSGQDSMVNKLFTLYFSSVVMQ